MSKKILVLGHVDHGSTITNRVVDAFKAFGNEPVVVRMGELPMEKGVEIPRLDQMIIEEQKSSGVIIKGVVIKNDGQTNRRERRKNKRK